MSVAVAVGVEQSGVEVQAISVGDSGMEVQAAMVVLLVEPSAAMHPQPQSPDGSATCLEMAASDGYT
jgi:hypothetical protein